MLCFLASTSLENWEITINIREIEWKYNIQNNSFS